MKNGWYEERYGCRYHYVDGLYHSINDEPAVINPNGHKAWFKEDMWHRETGPARTWASGRKEYWFRNEVYYEITSDLEWLLKVEELKSKKKFLTPKSRNVTITF